MWSRTTSAVPSHCALTCFMAARYRSLMLVYVVAIPPTGSPFFKFVQRHPGVMAELPQYVHRAILAAYIQGATHRGLRARDLDDLVAPWTTDEGQPAFYRQIEQTDERFLAEIEARLGQLDIPVRIVWGMDDAWIPTETAQRLCDLIPTATTTCDSAVSAREPPWPHACAAQRSVRPGGLLRVGPVE